MTRQLTKVVMLPGMDGTGLLFAPAVDTCPAGLEPVVVALPAREPLSYAGLAERLAPLLPSGEEYVLLGESFSGPLVLELAARRPTGLRGVVLVATFVTPPTPRWLPLLPWSLIFGFAPPAFLVRRLLIGREGSEELLGLFRRIPGAVAPEVMASRIRLVSAVDARSALKACPVPILYLEASRDRLVRSRSLDGILRVRPDVEVRRVDAPHLAFQTAPREVWEHVRAFV